ncbi:actin-like ATPase domain-containing protein [Violaceomyces palustris]|uniref:Actin-like ATPase domain-containing protein n=1 Tax=Violaceomyces palustris TaxID=1673888 RepID=A0ACD0P158_9BASI|nr:actin-like ATPase domain-containing protein [Violaceomyces palustris]
MAPKKSPTKFNLPPNPPADPSRDHPFAFTTFHPPPPINAKNVSSSYLKTEAQTWISRSQQQQQMTANLRGKKRKVGSGFGGGGMESGGDVTPGLDGYASDEGDEMDQEQKPQGPASKTIVIHPGSEYLRIGRATDLYPLSLPNVIARRPKKKKSPSPPPTRQAENGAASSSNQAEGDGTVDVEMGSDEAKGNAQVTKGGTNGMNDGVADEASGEGKEQDEKEEAEEEEEEEEEETPPLDGKRNGKKKDPLGEKIEGIRNELRAIMRQSKLRPVGNGRALAANYNDGVDPEQVPEHNDVYEMEWTESDVDSDETVQIGERALRLSCFSPEDPAKPSSSSQRRPWKLFRPFKRGTLDVNSYVDHYGDSAIPALLGDVRAILAHAITSPPEDPEERREAGHVAAHGLGIAPRDWEDYSVILIIPDLYSRSDIKALIELILLDMGFAAACIQTEGVCATFGAGLSGACVVDMGSDHISISCVEEGLVLPETRLALSYGGRDLSVFLGELLTRSNFPYKELDWNRRVADMMLLDNLKERLLTLNPADVGLNIHDFNVRLPDKPTYKYLFRTYDELIVAPMSLFYPRVYDLDGKPPLKGTSRIGGEDLMVDEVAADDAPELNPAFGHDVAITMAMQSCVKHLMPPPPPPVPSAEGGSTENGTPAAGGGVGETASAAAAPLNVPLIKSTAPSRNESPAFGGMEGSVLPSGEPSARPSPAPGTAVPAGQGATQASSSMGNAPAPPPKPTFDVAFEASKTPLDLAIWNSLQAGLATGGVSAEDRLRKMSHNILCVGGTALIPGLSSALEARLDVYLSNHAATSTGDASAGPRATVIPPPRDMDPKSLAWKGMSVFARLESINEMWTRRQDWEIFGFRSLKEKTLFL